jgi:hypothetical protein
LDFHKSCDETSPIGIPPIPLIAGIVCGSAFCAFWPLFPPMEEGEPGEPFSEKMILQNGPAKFGPLTVRPSG